MSNAPHLTDQVKTFIAELCTSNPGAGPKEIRKKLLKQIKESGLCEYFGKNWPGESVVGKEIRRFKEEASRLSLYQEDKPWTVAALADHGIVPEALLIVMKAWARELERGTYLTIREAKWMSLLYAVFPKIEELQKVTHVGDLVIEQGDVHLSANDVVNETLDLIIGAARRYANQERAIKLAGTYPANSDDALWLWNRDAGLYGDITGDFKLSVKILGQLKDKLKKGGK